MLQEGRAPSRLSPPFRNPVTASKIRGQVFNHPSCPPWSGEARCRALSRGTRYPTVTTRKLTRASLWHP